jgi:EpsI family protein
VDDELVGAYPSPTGEHRFSAVDDELVGAYRNSSGAKVQLYVGHYRRQEQGKELAGDAGHALQSSASALTLDQGSGAPPIGEITQERAGKMRGVLFWYDINGRIVSDIYHAKGYMMWDALTRRRTNGAVIMIAWEGPDGVQSGANRELAIDFAQALMPILRDRLPS